MQGKLGGLPVEALFNTHWHPTHTGGNETLRGADTTIVAHELLRAPLARRALDRLPFVGGRG